MSDQPRVLVVGAGAVGQVYARHAQQGGAEVTFFVRDKYRDAIVGLREGRPPLAMRLAARPGVLRMALWFAARALPLPLETYRKEHFTKVGDQTREFMVRYIARGKEAGLPVAALEELMATLPPLARRRAHAEARTA